MIEKLVKDNNLLKNEIILMKDRYVEVVIELGHMSEQNNKITIELEITKQELHSSNVIINKTRQNIMTKDNMIDQLCCQVKDLKLTN